MTTLHLRTSESYVVCSAFIVIKFYANGKRQTAREKYSATSVSVPSSFPTPADPDIRVCASLCVALPSNVVDVRCCGNGRECTLTQQPNAVCLMFSQLQPQSLSLLDEKLSRSRPVSSKRGCRRRRRHSRCAALDTSDWIYRARCCLGVSSVHIRKSLPDSASQF